MLLLFCKLELKSIHSDLIMHYFINFTSHKKEWHMVQLVECRGIVFNFFASIIVVFVNDEIAKSASLCDYFGAMMH